MKKLQNGEYAYQAPGMAKPVRITTRPDYFDEHCESMELWSPGSPSFPETAGDAMKQEREEQSLAELLSKL